MPTTAAAKAPVTELGHVSSWVQLQGWPFDPGEETGPTTWPESVRTYERMRRNSTVHSVLTAVTHPLRRPGIFSLDPQGARPEIVTQLAEDLDLPILGQDRIPPPRRRGRFSWLEHVRLALLGLTYGHMGFELVCDPVALAATGMARLAKLAPRFPNSISHIDVADDGGLLQIRQWSTVTKGGAGPEITIPVDRLVWYAHDREGAAWQGRSMLRPCYGDWLLLDRLLRVRAMLMERQGMGIPVGTAPQGADQDVIEAMTSIATKARAGESSGVGLPFGATLSFEGVRGTLPDIGAAIADHKAALADSVMASFMRLGTADASGNRALGQTFVDQFTQSEDTIAGWLADVATQHIVEDLVDLNWGPDEPAPAVVARAIDAETDINPEHLFRLVQAGVIVPDEALDSWARQRYRMPKRVGPYVAPGVPAAPVPVTDPTVAAARRVARSVSAAKAKTWAERVAEVLSTAVDPEAIAAAALDGSDPAAAVDEGLSIDDTTALAALLVEMWNDSYNAGADRAGTDKVAASRGIPREKRGAPVMASLASMLAEASDIAGGILSSLRDRLVSGIEGVFGAGTTPEEGGLVDLLASLGDDTAAAERVAETETHRAEISGAADTWAAMGVVETRWVRKSGSDLDDDCAALDGTTSAEWDSLPPLHPNCLCEIEPV